MLARFLLLAVISVGIIEKCSVLCYYARDTDISKGSEYEELDHPMAEDKEYKEVEEPRSVIHYKRTRMKRSVHPSYSRPLVAAPGIQKYNSEGEVEESDPNLAFAENHKSPVSI